jgi:hypothetical protein
VAPPDTRSAVVAAPDHRAAARLNCFQGVTPSVALGRSMEIIEHEGVDGSRRLAGCGSEAPPGLALAEAERRRRLDFEDWATPSVGYQPVS